MNEPLSFGAWLKRRRKVLDLTQEGLAQLVGCAVGGDHEVAQVCTAAPA